MTQQIINNKDAGETGYSSRTKINNNFTETYQNKAWLSTGILSGGELTIGVDNVSVNISAGFALFVDNTNPLQPVFTKISIGGNVLITNIVTQSRTYIGYNKNGIVQQGTPFTNVQRRTIASIGIAIHTDNATITFINSLVTYMSDIPLQMYDIAFAMDRMNMAGNVFFANGANLKINKTQGEIFKVGVEGIDNPFYLTLPLLNSITFQYRLQNGTVTSTTDLIDCSKYDLNGVLTSVDVGKFTIQRINIFQSNAVRIQYGQKQYNTIEDAKYGINNDEFIVESNIAENGFLRCHLIVKQGTTDLTDTSKVKFIEVNKYGMVAGSVGAALTATNIQTALGYTPLDQEYYYDIYEDQHEPTGFPADNNGMTDISKSELTEDYTNRIFGIQPTGVSFEYYAKGVRYTISSHLTTQITDTEGDWLFYIDINDNILKCSQSLTIEEFILKHVAIAQGYWDKDNQKMLMGLRDERHGMSQSGASHLFNHETYSTRLEDSTGGLINFTIGDGSSANHAKFIVDNTTIWDEDKRYISSQTTSTIENLYRIAQGKWRSSINTGYAFLTAGSGRIAYRNNSYVLTEVDESKFVCLHIYATTGITNVGQIYSVTGSNQYNSINEAVIGSLIEIENLKQDDFPVNEECLLGTVIFQAGSAFVGGAKIVQITDTTGVYNYIDRRNNKLGYISENTSNKTTTLDNNSTLNQYPAAKTVFDAISNLALGILPQDPIELINLIGSTNVYVTPHDYDAYILNTGAAASFTANGASGFVDGDIVQSQSGVYIKIKTLTVNDRFVIGGVSNTTPIGIGLNKKNYIAVCSNATPSSLAFNYTAPQNSMILYVNNINAYYHGVIYSYSGTSLKWVQLSSTFAISYGNGLTLTGNVLNLGQLTQDWIQNGNFDITHAGTFNGLRLTKQAIGFTIAGGTTSKTLTVNDNASVSGSNTGDQDLSGLVPNTRTVNGKQLNANISLDNTDVGLTNVTNNAQLKIASNLSDLNNTSTARTNLGLGTLATQSGTFSGSSSGTNTGDETTTRIATLNHSASAKVSIVDSDEITGQDSENTFSLIRVTFASIKSFLKTYFDGLYQTLTNKDASGGYVGLTLFKINFKNAANTFTSFFTNTNSASRTYTFKDADGTIAFTSDIPANIALTTGNLSQFAATTSAQLFGVLSDETGSGTGAKAVFSINPTMVAPILTSTALDVSPVAGKFGYNGDWYLNIANAVRMALGGVLYTDVANRTGVTGTGEQTASTYTLPAATLDVDTELIEVTSHFSVTGAGNSTLRLYFGATAIYTSNTGNMSGFEVTLNAKIYRISATTQKAIVQMRTSGNSPTVIVTYTTTSETLSGAVIIKSTLQNATTGANITGRIFEVKHFGAPA